ncbi:MAG: FAD-binding oxidoreductase [Bacteroidetes bacterium]|nr:FAD-binding oxidoreductase [Bacteroidota bacterium]MBU1116765.1 FAD-binding oxidoreductase [Bacteroidota bacterium]MBU1798846.1 FAD-binding oxidoreductase [Bacteroidota bacterium]
MIIKKDKSEIQNFLVDAANYKGDCEAVYFPESESDILIILALARNLKQRITIAGNGTGLTGARVPEGGIVISMNKMNNILEINTAEKYAIVQPAVILREFQNEVTANRLFYPPDPTEQDCFIGASIATNASGAKSFKYGPTRNYVIELRIILSNGEVLNLKRGNNFADGNLLNLISESGSQIEISLPDYLMPNTKHSAGYFTKINMDAIDLFIGSEGTLGIITEAKLKLLEIPENLISGILFFNNEADALDFVDDARSQSIKHRMAKDENNINARGIEFFDFYSLQFLKEDYPKINDNHKAAIWFEQEINSESEEFLFDKWMSLVEKYNADIDNSWFAMDKIELEKFKNFRHAVSSKVSEFVAQKGVRKVGTDTAVPVEHFRDYYFEMKKDVAANNLNYICYGHIGDCHLHLNMLPQNADELITAKSLYARFCARVVELGGTISAEHGVGKMKRDYLFNMYGKKNILEMARIKKILDPNLLLGIGNIFDEKFLIN